MPNTSKREDSSARAAAIPVKRLRLYGMIALCGAAVVGIQAATFFRGGAEAATGDEFAAAAAADADPQPLTVLPEESQQESAPPSLTGPFDAASGFQPPQPIDLEAARAPLADVGRWLAQGEIDPASGDPTWINALANSLEASSGESLAVDSVASGDSTAADVPSAAPQLTSPHADAEPPVPSQPESSQSEQATLISFEISNPASNGGAVRFLVGKELVTLTAGETKTLQAAADAAIRFDRGGDFGPAQYPPRAGRFTFVVEERGWDLKQQN